MFGVRGSLAVLAAALIVVSNAERHQVRKPFVCIELSSSRTLNNIYKIWVTDSLVTWI